MTSSSRLDLVTGLHSRRSSLLELFMVAGALALAINLIANIVFARVPRIWVVVGSATITLVCGLYLWVRKLGSLRYAFDYEGFLLYDNESKEFIDIPNYDFSEEVVRDIKAAFFENPALAAQWKREPLEKTISEDDQGPPHAQSQWYSTRLLRELVEYIVLAWLSTHLVDHFSRPEFDDSLLQEYRHTNLSNIISTNRFLQLFSQPMEDRPAFLEEGESMKSTNKGWVTVEAIAGDTIYRSFELTLPLKSRVRRTKTGAIEIDSPELRVTLQPVFDGYDTTVPWSFLEYYVRLRRPPCAFHVYSVGVSVTVRVKFRGLFSKSTWRYHAWSEQFLKELDEKISKDTFLSRIQWPSVEAVLHCLTISGVIKEPRAEDLIAIAGESSDNHEGSTPSAQGGAPGVGAHCPKP